jgi:REP element-mobilizing transposase RayT
MAHTYHKLLVRVIFSTKNREPLIDPGWAADLYAYMGGIILNRKGDLLAAGGIPDHVHLLVRLPADLPLSDLVRDVKAVSSKWRHDAAHPAFAWQTGYGGFSVSQSLAETVTDYIHRQPDHHRARTFQQEYVDFLRKHEVEYDDRYLWD